jgi:hypothetical protein
MLSFRLDGLSLLFAGLITGIGLLIVVYAHFYLSPTDSVGKFYSQMMLFMAAMLEMIMQHRVRGGRVVTMAGHVLCSCMAGALYASDVGAIMLYACECCMCHTLRQLACI